MATARIIAIETSSPRGSVALGQGETLLAEREFPAQTEHARELFVTVDCLCREAGWGPGDVTECYVSIGPGSFTGLRVAVTFARTLALATGVRLYAVPTLEVIAANCAAIPRPPLRLGVMLPARRDAVFAALFDWCGTEYAAKGSAEMIDPRRFIESAGGGAGHGGEAVRAHGELIAAVGSAAVAEEFWTPRAAGVFLLGRRLAANGRFTPPRELIPLYIRRPEAEEVWERRSATNPAPR